MPEITITIKSSGDTKYEVTVAEDATVADLKNLVQEKADVEPERQRLIYSGKVLKDNETVASYKIQTGHTVHLVKSAQKTGGASATSAAASTTGAPTGAVPSNISAGQGAFNPLADLTGARYAGYTQLPSASMFGPDGGMNQALPDPEQMSQMMNNPMVQESMNAMLSNPQMLDYMIEQSPQLRAMGPQVRQMMQSPFFRQMMQNPEMMRSMMEMGRNMGGDNPLAGFPAPGSNPTVGANAAAEASPDSDANSGTPANPFASMFPNGMPPIDPFALFGQQPPAAQDTDSRPPEERYESQLRQLNDMGFFDFDRNVAALRRSGGNVQGAVEHLLSE